MRIQKVTAAWLTKMAPAAEQEVEAAVEEAAADAITEALSAAPGLRVAAPLLLLRT
jgi:hypothetical protein